MPLNMALNSATAISRDGFTVTAAPEGVARFRRDAAGRFVNLDGSGPHPFGAVYKWAVRDKLAGRRRKSPARAPVPAVDVDPRRASVCPRDRASRPVSSGWGMPAGWSRSPACRC